WVSAHDRVDDACGRSSAVVPVVLAGSIVDAADVADRINARHIGAVIFIDHDPVVDGYPGAFSDLHGRVNSHCSDNEIKTIQVLIHGQTAGDDFNVLGHCGIELLCQFTKHLGGWNMRGKHTDLSTQ